MSTPLAIGAIAALAAAAQLSKRGSRSVQLSDRDIQDIEKAAKVYDGFLRDMLVREGYAKAGEPGLYSVDVYKLDDWMHRCTPEGWCFDIADIYYMGDRIEELMHEQGIEWVGAGGYRYAIKLPDSGMVAKLPMHSEGADGIEQEVHSWVNAKPFPELRRHLLPVVSTGRVRTRRDQDKTIPFLVMPMAISLVETSSSRIKPGESERLVHALQMAGLSGSSARAEVASFWEAVTTFQQPRPLDGHWAQFDPRRNPRVVLCEPDLHFGNLAVYDGRLVLLDYQCY